jgi:hypothetical protein
LLCAANAFIVGPKFVGLMRGNGMGRSALSAAMCLAMGLVSTLFAGVRSEAQAQNSAENRFPPSFAGTWTRKGDITPTGEHDPTSPSTFQAPPDGPSTIVTSVPHYGHCDYLPPGVRNSDPCPPGVTESRESNAWIADYTNPILLPWTREALKQNAEGEAVGISHTSFQQHCKPSGVPQILNLRYQVQFLQGPDQLTILYENNQQIRRVYMNQKHPENFERSWYGHSIGHYEGDTLVIDTIGQVDFTELDRFGTLHTDALHVVERYRIREDGILEAIFTVEDQGAFTTPWRGVATYIPQDISFPEFICAENNRATTEDQVFDVPHDLEPDF